MSKIQKRVPARKIVVAATVDLGRCFDSPVADIEASVGLKRDHSVSMGSVVAPAKAPVAKYANWRSDAGREGSVIATAAGVADMMNTVAISMCRIRCQGVIVAKKKVDRYEDSRFSTPRGQDFLLACMTFRAPFQAHPCMLARSGESRAVIVAQQLVDPSTCHQHAASRR